MTKQRNWILANAVVWSVVTGWLLVWLFQVGPIGPKGDSGEAGEIGANGITGDRGKSGPKGTIGNRGPKGETTKYVPYTDYYGSEGIFCTIGNGGVNMRSAPTVYSSKVTEIPQSACSIYDYTGSSEVEIGPSSNGKTETWRHVTWNGYTGWVVDVFLAYGY